MRLSWRLDVRWLLDQPSLMQSDLAPFRDELASDRDGATDLLEHAALIWRELNTVVLRYEKQYPAWSVLRYEDLAAAPASGIRELCRHVGIPWTSRLQDRVEKRNAPHHGVAVPERSRGGTRRDSRRAMWTWVDRLTPEEIDRVRASTESLARHWYVDDDWTPGRGDTDRGPAP